MGAVHPRGPNVVNLTQYGGGKNCDCGPPHFDKYYDPRLGGVGISQQEFNEKIDQTNNVFKRHRPNMPVYIFLMVFFAAVVPNILIRTLTQRNAGNNCGATQFVCPDSRAKANSTTLVWPDQKDDLRNCGDADMMVNSYCSEDTGCYKHLVRMCCEETPGVSSANDDDKGRKKKKGKCGGASPLLALTGVFPVLSVGLFIVVIWKARKVIDQKIQDLFSDWKAKGVAVVYTHASKHSHGSLSFVLPNNMMANQQMMMMYPPQMVGGGIQSVGQPLQHQQTGQVEMIPMQATQMIQPTQPMVTPVYVQGGMQPQPTPAPVTIAVAK